MPSRRSGSRCGGHADRSGSSGVVMVTADEGPVTWAVVRRAQAGDKEAVAAIYRRYRSDVYILVRRSVPEATRAEDIVSETFLRALRGLGRVEERADNIRPWLLTIARNRVMDHFKSASVRREIMAGDLPDRPATGGEPEAEMLRRARQQAVRDLLRMLNPEQRRCLELRFIRDLGVAETARLMDRPEGAVRALQHRALRKLAALVVAEEPLRAA